MGFFKILNNKKHSTIITTEFIENFFLKENPPSWTRLIWFSFEFPLKQSYFIEMLSFIIAGSTDKLLQIVARSRRYESKKRYFWMVKFNF